MRYLLCMKRILIFLGNQDMILKNVQERNFFQPENLLNMKVNLYLYTFCRYRYFYTKKLLVSIIRE